MTQAQLLGPTPRGEAICRLGEPRHDYVSPRPHAIVAGTLVAILIVLSGTMAVDGLASRVSVRSVAAYHAAMPWWVGLWIAQGVLLIAAFIAVAVWHDRVIENVEAFGLVPAKSPGGLTTVVRTCRCGTADAGRRTWLPDGVAWSLPLVGTTAVIVSVIGVVVTKGEQESQPLAAQLDDVRAWYLVGTVGQAILLIAWLLWLPMIIHVTSIQMHRRWACVDLDGLLLAPPRPEVAQPVLPVFRDAGRYAAVVRIMCATVAVICVLAIATCAWTATRIRDTGDYEGAMGSIQLALGIIGATVAAALIVGCACASRLTDNYIAIHRDATLGVSVPLFVGNDGAKPPQSWLAPWSKVVGAAVLALGWGLALDPLADDGDFHRTVTAAEFAEIRGWLLLGVCGCALLGIGCILSMRVVTEATAFQQTRHEARLGSAEAQS